MGNAVVGTAGPQRTKHTDPASEQAEGGISLFGVTPSRAIKIPLKHWKQSLGLLAVCAACAYLYGEFRSTQTYKSVGRLVHRPPPEQKDIPTPKNLETLIEEMKKDEYFGKINEKFGMGIQPELWAKFFDIKKPPTNDMSQIIMVTLEWEDRDKGAELVNYLMELHRDAATEDRKKELFRSLESTKESLEDCNRRLERARKAVQEFLDGRNFKGNDPKQRLASLEAAIKDVETEMRKTEAEYNGNVRDKGKLEVDIDKLKEAQQQNLVKPDKEAVDPEFEEKRANLQKELRKAKQELEKAEYELDQSVKDYNRKEDLARKKIITAPEWSTVVARKKNAESAIVGLKKDVEDFEMKLQKLRPSVARLQDAQKELKLLETLMKKNRNNLDLQRVRLEEFRKEQQQVLEIHRAWDPKAKEVESLEKEQQVVGEKREELNRRLRDVTGELRISSPAAPSLLPLSNRKKQTVIGFVIPLVLGLGLMIGRELMTKLLRAEVMADRLRLPILAESDSGGRGTAKGSGLSADQSRALSLRIRQFVPEEGGAVLISSLNDRNGVDPLVTDLARYFAMRNEHVLILDARIAQGQAAGLAGMIERRVDGQAPEVVPWQPLADGPERAGPGVAGLVQYLVFEGQSYTTFAYHTRLPGVDYMPAGGPYPVTDALASEPMDELLRTLRKEYSLLLIVGPAVTRAVDTEILAAYADGMIMVLNNPLSAFSPAIEEFVRSLKAKNAPLLGSVICV